MYYLSTLIAFALALVPGACFAQSHAPYAGMETRIIKALSDQEISDLRAGLGMRLALPAELNGYPGPRHVLELANELRLSSAQRAKLEELVATMKAESIPIGERLIAQEAELDRQFAGKTATLASLQASTQAIGATLATLRAIHLKYHLLTRDLLTSAQSKRYLDLRGYTAGQQHDPARHGN